MEFLENLEWLLAILQNHQEDRKVSKILSAQSRLATKPGDNYTSLMLRTKVSGLRGSGNPFSTNLIVKKKLPSQQTAGLLNKVFLGERTVYKRILDQYKEMTRGTPLVGLEMWPTCYFGSKDAVVMEDLKILGYQMADRKKGLDLAHGLLVMRSLGRLHGLSIVAMDRNLVIPSILGLFTFLDDSCRTLYISLFTALSNSVKKNWEPEWIPISEKLKEFGFTARQRLTEKYFEEAPLKVICHGDCWINNQMYKYDSQSLPVHVKFVDFQLSHFGSYAWDLNYFLHSSIHKEIRETHYSTFLSAYRNSMEETFQILGHNDNAPSLEDIERECQRLRIFSFVMDAIIAPMTSCNSEDVIGIDDLLSDPTKSEHLYSREEIANPMKASLKKYIEDGIF